MVSRCGGVIHLRVVLVRIAFSRHLVVHGDDALPADHGVQVHIRVIGVLLVANV